jgi:hypothetical protein
LSSSSTSSSFGACHYYQWAQIKLSSPIYDNTNPPHNHLIIIINK